MDVVCDVTGNIGELILNRPAALNAIDLPMVRALRAGLDAFVANADVHAIILRSAGEGAFCAGGDVRHLRSLVLRGEYDLVRDFFTEEYALNAAIAACPKPYVSLIDGICMGGGLGLSIHGRYRVVTERARLALPETAIGFFPDIGASFFLPRLPGASGLWLGLTGARLEGSQAVALGLATHYVPAVRLAALHAALRSSREDIGSLIGSFAAPVAAGTFAAQRLEIDALFGAGTLADIFAALRAAPTPFCEGCFGEPRPHVAKQFCASLPICLPPAATLRWPPAWQPSMPLRLSRRATPISPRASARCSSTRIVPRVGATQTPDRCAVCCVAATNIGVRLYVQAAGRQFNRH